MAVVHLHTKRQEKKHDQIGERLNGNKSYENNKWDKQQWNESNIDGWCEHLTIIKLWSNTIVLK